MINQLCFKLYNHNTVVKKIPYSRTKLKFIYFFGIYYCCGNRGHFKTTKRHCKWKWRLVKMNQLAIYKTWTSIYTLFFNKNKLNKNIEAEIARKIRTILEQSEAEIFFTNLSLQCKHWMRFTISFSSTNSGMMTSTSPSLRHTFLLKPNSPKVACFRFDILMDEKTCSAPHANSALVQQYHPRSVSFAHLLQLLNPTV